MPKSKRAKVVHTSKTEKKGKELSHKLYQGIRECCDKYQYCFVFSVDNMRNTYLKEVRTDLSDSRLYFGKTKVMAKALGTTPEEEPMSNLSQLSQFVTGNVGLLFTSREPESIIEYFDGFIQTDFARAGIEATRDVVLPEGIVYSRGGEIPVEDDVPMPHSMEPTLKQWGVPTRLDKGKVVLDGAYELCRAGQPLKSNQTAILKLLGITMADFRVKLKAYYNSATQQVTVLDSEDD